jgi:hypothetical protein
MRSINDFRRLANQSGGNLQSYLTLCGTIDPTNEYAAAFQAWNEYQNQINKVNTSTSSSEGIDLTSAKNIQNLTSSVKSYRATDNDLIQPGTIISEIEGGLKSIFSDGGLFGKGNFKDNFEKFGTDLLQGTLNKVIGGGADILQKEVELHNEINSRIGISGELSRAFRTEIVESLPDIVSMGYGFEDIKNTQIAMMEESGKFVMNNKEVFRDIAETSRAFVGDMDTLGKMLGTYEKAGFGAADALEKINEAGESSYSLGLNSRKVVSEIETNMKSLNSYGFKNGFEGLSRMVQKSIEFRLSMQSVLTLADKLFDPEQAINLSAQLQAIGGTIGDFNDPLKLMYLATNDAGGLQEAMINVAGSLATYNSELGKFEITGVNLRRARAMATELGMTMDELSTTSIKAAERASASADLLSQGFNLDEKQKEFITNLAKMEDGKMVIDIPQSLSSQFEGATRVALSDLNDNQVKVLLDNQKELEKMNARDIALSQYTETQKMALNVSEIAAMLKVQFAGGVRAGLSGVDKYIKGINDFLVDTKEGKGGLGTLLVGKQFDEARKRGEGYVEDTYKTTPVNDAIIRPNMKQIIVPSVNDTIYAVDETKNTGSNVVTHRHEHIIKESSVMMDTTRRMYEEELRKQNTSEYDGYLFKNYS